MILITGNAGFIGSRLSQKLKQHVGIDLKYGKSLLTCPLPTDIKVIYHLAAQTSVEESWKDPLKDSWNFNMTVRIAQHYPDAKIIFAQSAAAIEASSPYGFSKSMSGEYLKKFHKNAVICVFPNVFGGGTGVVDIFRGKKEVTIYGDGEQVRDFVHVDDIIQGLILAKDWEPGEYFMGSTVGTKVKDLAIGKKVTIAPARQEIRESILPNTTPNWRPTINVIKYINA